jgi:hypothetical protein
MLLLKIMVKRRRERDRPSMRKEGDIQAGWIL